MAAATRRLSRAGAAKDLLDDDLEADGGEAGVWVHAAAVQSGGGAATGRLKVASTGATAPTEGVDTATLVQVLSPARCIARTAL